MLLRTNVKLKEDGEDELTVTIFWAFNAFCVTLTIWLYPYLGHLLDSKKNKNSTKVSDDSIRENMSRQFNTIRSSPACKLGDQYLIKFFLFLYLQVWLL